jgi:hypothetical protein
MDFFDGQGIVESIVFGNRTNDLSFQVWSFGD